VHKVRESLT